MDLDSFEYQQVDQQMTTLEDESLPNIQSEQQSSGSKRYMNHLKILTKTLFTITLLGVLVYVNKVYSVQDRVCPYNTDQECFSEFMYDKFPSILLNMIILSSIYGAIFFLTFVIQCFRKIHLTLSIATFLIMILYHHERSSYYNFSYMYSYIVTNMTLIIMLCLFGVYYVILLFIWACRRKLFIAFTLILMIIMSLVSISFIFYLQPSYAWTQGIMGKVLHDSTPEGQKYCKIQLPRWDWHQLFDGKLDFTYHYYDCTKKDFTDHTNNQFILEKYIKDYNLGRYIAFPVLNDFTNPFKRTTTQNYIIEKAKVYNNKKDIPDHIEYILDKESLVYDINVKRNKKLVKQRELQHKLQNKLFKDEKLKRIPAKNVIVIYIDALSRMAFMKKFPKMRKFYHEHSLGNKDQYTTFFGMRAHSIASFTYHNIMAYFYGAVSERSINNHSPYSLTEGATNVENIQEIDPRTGKDRIRKQFRGGVSYSSFIRGFQDSGYITGMTSTDCATSPLTQDSIDSLPFIEDLIYDHMGITHSCDPNYFLPYYQASQGQGPYALLRRCLYGEEVIDYSITYAKQFMTKYEDQPKFFQFELLEAHERSQEVVTYSDEKLYNFMNWMVDNGHMKDSAFMFISDHGYHMRSLLIDYYVSEDMLQTDNGFPLQILLIDNKLLEGNDTQNLNKNEQRITTMFEIYHFLRYLITPKLSAYHRDNSLVTDKIPVDRESYDLPELDALPLICFKQQ